jgi:chemotaxis protein MotB
MPVKKKVEPEEQSDGAPEWMVTFSDCMTLLLTFFVLLLSFSSFDYKIFWRLKVIYCEALANTSPSPKSDSDSFKHLAPIKYLKQPDRGSEKPTLKRIDQDGLLEETEEPEDFQNRKVFIVSSKKMFWGKGAAISSEGRDIMSTMASFLKQVPNRVVISESGPSDEYSVQFGLQRAWAVLEYLTEVKGLEKKRFSISAASTIPKDGLNKGQVVAGLERTIEIVLLERSIYN